jgi:uncharacterized protein YfbU (UPF0304 family)
MHLTKLERLLLVQQCSLLSAMRPDQAEANAALVELLVGGYKIFYGDAVNHLLDDMPEEESQFVLRALAMYEALEAYEAAHPEDAAIAQHPWGRFRGFDAKTEPQHHGFAVFVIRRMGRFPSRLAAATQGQLDAGSPAIPRVRPMTIEWEAQGAPAALTHEQAAALLLASGV